MKTKILTEKDWELVVEPLKNGEVVAIPTETVYGLAARFDREESVKKIFEIKNRPADNPLILHISSLEMISQIAEELPSFFYTLADTFFPGPLTIIARKKESVLDIVTGSHTTVAFRMPSHPIARSIIEEVGCPLAAPSANLSGKPSPTTSMDVLEDLEGKIPYIVDGGNCEHGIESTVLDLSGEKPAILRPGVITKADLEKKLNISLENSSQTPSPGMKYRHYSPKARVFLFFTSDEWKEYIRNSPTKKRMLLSEDKEGISCNQQNLYSLFREADRKGCDEILIDCSGNIGQDEALMNRLQKARTKITI